MSSDWYARKLNGNVPNQLPSLPPTQLVPAAPPFNPQQPQDAPRVPTNSSVASRCPGCGSGNYGGVVPEGSMSGMAARAKCYDCGYPIVQSGSGVGKGISQPGGGPATPAKQISTANNWNPQGIIGHI